MAVVGPKQVPMPEDSWPNRPKKTQIDRGVWEQRLCAWLPGENPGGDEAHGIAPGLCGELSVIETAAW